MSAVNPLICTPIYSDAGVSLTPTASGGSWLSALPVSNVLDRRLHYIARSSDDAAASTQFDIDLGVARSVRAIAILLPNISKSGATLAFKGSNTAGDFTGAELLHDSGTFDPWPAGIDAEEAEGYNVWSWFDFGSLKSARYWRTEIVDTSNTDGYVDVARIAISGGVQLTGVGVSYGGQRSFESESERHYTEGGAAIYLDRRRRRVFNGIIRNALDTELLDNIHPMHARGGIARQFFWIENPSESATYAWRQNFLATWRELSPIEASTYNRSHLPLPVLEEL